MMSRIRSARRERGWSQIQLIAELERVAARGGTRLPSRETLKSRVSRWENGRARPDEFYRRLLREAFGLDDRELGFARDVEGGSAPAVDELRARLVLDCGTDGTLLDALRAQTESIRLQDRQFGARALLEQMRAHVANIEQHLDHRVFDSTRRPLAQLLADAAALAGWQALDLGAIDQAWRFFEIATRAAQQAQDPALYAFSRVEQAQVLVELNLPRAAAELVQSTCDRGRALVSPGVHCWLAAAAAEMHAAAGQAEESRRSLSDAEDHVDQLDGDLPPYLVFNRDHLERWFGHTLTILGDPAAERALRSAANVMDQTFNRAKANLHVDLAATLLARGDRDEAADALRRAELLAMRLGSRRLLSRVRDLRPAS